MIYFRPFQYHSVHTHKIGLKLKHFALYPNLGCVD